MKQLIVSSVTLSRIGFAVVIIFAAGAGQWNLVFGLALLAFATDWLDGCLARRWHVASRFGMFFDPLADKIVCLTLLWLIAARQGYAFYWAAAAAITLYDTLTMSLRLKNLKTKSMPASRAAKFKTALLMSGLTLALIGITGGDAWWGTAGIYASFGLLGTAVVISVFSLSGYVKNYVLRQKTPRVEKHHSVTEIDFAAWHKVHGIDYVLFDVEGTLTAWADHRVEQEVLEALTRAKAGGIKEFGLISNMHSRHARRLKTVAEQTGAKTWQLPKTRRQRKPGRFMVRKALRELEAKPENTGFVGDKLVDVMTAKRSGLKRATWVNRHGTADQILDKLFYRPLEPVIKKLIT